jgi:Uma2 family endonuclease
MHMATTTKDIPPLESGDHLNRIEFERRYENMPDLKKAELVDGVVYVQSAVRYEGHGRQHAAMAGWLEFYSAETPGTEVGDNPTLRLDPENAPQPDLLLRVIESRGGQSRVDAEGYIDGAPELIVEIASSSVSYDLHQKLAVYLRHGVREYVVWRVLNGQIDWFILQDGRFERLLPAPSAIYKSRYFPGLWLDAAAMLRGERSAVFHMLQAGIASPEHADFVRRLNGMQP